MKCDCGSETRCVDSRPSRGGRVVRRRRECLDCGDRFTTYESKELPVDLGPTLVEAEDIRADRDEAIRDLYEAGGLTHPDLAHAFGLHPSTVQRILDRGNEP